MCVFACAIQTRRDPFYGLERRRPRGLVAGREAGDLDSEGDDERPFLEQKPPPRLEAGAQVSLRKGQ